MQDVNKCRSYTIIEIHTNYDNDNTSTIVPHTVEYVTYAFNAGYIKLESSESDEYSQSWYPVVYNSISDLFLIDRVLSLETPNRATPNRSSPRHYSNRISRLRQPCALGVETETRTSVSPLSGIHAWCYMTECRFSCSMYASWQRTQYKFSPSVLSSFPPCASLRCAWLRAMDHDATIQCYDCEVLYLGHSANCYTHFAKINLGKEILQCP